MPNLPHYNGPYTVGFVDIESDSLEDQKYGVFMRIYYPTVEEERKKSFVETWLPNAWRYSHGYGAFLKLPRIASAMLFYPALGRVRMPCIKHAPILNMNVPDKLPVAIFSHGLGGSRTTYSNICGNMASRGMIVVAIEHGDGSACVTSKSGIEIPYEHPNDDNIQPSETKDEYLMRFRTTQLAHRCDEVSGALKTLHKLDAGELNFQTHMEKVPELIEEHQNCVKGFKNKIDFKNMALVGHSFGVHLID